MKWGLLLVWIAVLPATAHAEIYKWKDKDGHVRYSDVPPPSNIKNEAIGKKTQRPSPSPVQAVSPEKESADKSAAPISKDAPPPSKEDAAAKRAQDAEAQKKADAAKQAELKFKQESCAAARKNLAMFNNGGRIVMTDDKGERKYLGDDEIARGKADAERDVEKFCE